MQWLASAMFSAVLLTHSAGIPDRDVALLGRSLVEEVGVNDDVEIGAFVVSAGGELRLARWPQQRAFRRAAFHGPIPRNAVAVMHTHPAALPRPSLQDRLVAKRLCVPVYVASRAGLWVVRTDGRIEKVR